MGHGILDCYGLNFAQPFELSHKIACMTGVVGHGLFAHNRPHMFLTYNEKDDSIEGLSVHK